MRLHRLGLTRFGKFTDFALEFGPLEDGAPDLHVIYGPNEAGKSTIYAAILDLFFSIPNKSPHNFLHEYKTMRIDGAVETEDGIISLARLKKASNDLIGADDRPLSLNPFAASLGGLDRDGYAAMFSLNEHSLATGGKSLLEAKGDFGRILYGASAGLANFSERLNAVHAQADAFHRPRARATALKVLLEQLKALSAQKADIDVLAPEYQRLQNEQAAAAAANTAALEGQRAQRGTLEALRRQSIALPHLATLQEKNAALAPLQDLPDPPEDWRGRVTDLRDEATKLDVRATELTKRRANLDEDIAALLVDEAILGQARQIEDLNRLNGRYTTAEADLPRRIKRLQDLDASMASEAKRLTGNAIETPHSLLLSPAAKGAIVDLAENWAALSERLTLAQGEAETAMSAIIGAALEPLAQAALEAALDAATADDASARVKLYSGNITALQQTADSAMAALAPWSGDAINLRALAAPSPDQVDGWQAEKTTASDALRRQQDAADVAATTMLREQARMDAIVSTTAAPDAASLQALLADRDAAWQAHRNALDIPGADAFHALMAATDTAFEARFANADAMASVAKAAEAVAVAKAEHTAATALGDQARRAIEAVSSVISHAAEAIGLAAGTSLDAFAAWLALRDDALQAQADVEAETALRDTAEGEAAAIAKQLCDALKVGEESRRNTAALIQLAQTRLEDSRTTASALHALKHRQTALAKAEDAAATWHLKWAEALSDTWLHALTDSVASVRDALQALDDLAKGLNERDHLAGRIANMQADQKAFMDALKPLRKNLNNNSNNSNLIDESTALHDKLSQARTQDEVRRQKQTDIDRVKADQQALDARKAEQQTAAKKLLKFFKTNSLGDILQMLPLISERVRILEDIARLEQQITQNTGMADLSAAIAALKALDPRELAADISELEAALDLVDAETRERYAKLQAAKAALAAIGGDAEAARLEERRQTVLQEIEAGAANYLRLKLGALAAEHALEAYRAEHQSGMLARASKAFREITQGAYTGLATQADGKRETLIALAANGASRLDDEGMSTGTRAQLYLALRIAGYHEFADKQAPPPFIADDIIETFDDARAAETFKLLAGMALRGQVIYLTHHQHLLPIIAEVAPGARIHKLP